MRSLPRTVGHGSSRYCRTAQKVSMLDGNGGGNRARVSELLVRRVDMFNAHCSLPPRVRFVAPGGSRDVKNLDKTLGNVSRRAVQFPLFLAKNSPREIYLCHHIAMKIDIDLVPPGQIRWEVIDVAQGEYIVPGMVGDRLLMSIISRILLGGNFPNLALHFDAVTENSSLLRSLAVHHYFAKDLNACPMRKLRCRGFGSGQLAIPLESPATGSSRDYAPLSLRNIVFEILPQKSERLSILPCGKFPPPGGLPRP